MNMKSPRLILPLALIFAILAVSTASILIRFAQRDAPSIVIAALRLTFASLILSPYAFFRYRGEIISLPRRHLFLTVLSGLFLALHFAAWISSLEYTSVANSVVFVSTGPLWVALLAPFFLHERVPRGAIGGLALALLGGMIIGFFDTCVWIPRLSCPSIHDILNGRAMWGNFLALVGAWAVSGYLIMGRKLRGQVSLVAYISVVYGTAAVGLILAMLAFHETPFGYPPITYFWLLLLALIPQLIGHSIYNWSLRYLPAALVAIATLGEPIGSALLAYIVLYERPSFAVLLGGGLILAGIYIASRGSNERGLDSI
jgi:drug/metabolite transporter (DMT)-like permease